MENYPRLDVRFKDDVLAEELSDEAVLLNLEDERYFGLDEVGLRFWQLLQKHGNSTDVISEFLQEYKVEESVTQKDLAKFILELEQAGLLVIE